MTKKEIRKLFCYELKGTKKQLDEMYKLMNYEDFYNPLFTKYFDLWIGYYGYCYFPKKEYFVSRNGNTNYNESYLEYKGSY